MQEAAIWSLEDMSEVAWKLQKFGLASRKILNYVFLF